MKRLENLLKWMHKNEINIYIYQKNGVNEREMMEI